MYQANSLIVNQATSARIKLQVQEFKFQAWKFKFQAQVTRFKTKTEKRLESPISQHTTKRGLYNPNPKRG